jgi:uncharacterized protein YjdB
MSKRLMAVIVALVMLFSSFSVSFADAGLKQYTDVDGHWAAKAIYKWSDYGIIKGSNGYFRPNDYITRGEMACILDNMMGYKAIAKNTFSDLKDGQFYTDAVLKVYAAGIMKGDGNSIIRPTDKITREEAAVLLAKAFAVDDGVIGNSKFVDSQSVATWARASVFGLEAKGYVNGNNGCFNPKTNITRAEIIAIIDRIVKAYYTKAGIYSENVAGTAVIKADAVALQDVDISGNLIIAEGVGQGDVTLNSVTVKGNTVVRGGGENSVHINGKSSISKIRIEKAEDKIRIVVEDGNTVDIVVAKGEEIIITGSVGELEIATPDAVINAEAADIENTKVTGSNVTINADKDTKIGNVTVDSTAEKTAVKTEKGAVLGTVTAAAKVDISGEGSVENVVLNKGADNSTISTPNTKTTVNEGVNGVTSGGVSVEAGSTVKNDDKGKGEKVTTPTTPSIPSTPSTPSTPSNPSTPTNPTTPSAIAVTGITVDKQTLTLTEGDTATIIATITPSNATNKSVNWTTSDPNVVTVDGGKVTAVGKGTATITATSAENAGISATTNVTVNPKQNTSIDFMDSYMASFEANTNVLSFSVKGKLIGEIDTSKLKYITSISGEHSYSLSSGYTKSEMQDIAAGKYYYTNYTDGETGVYIKLTDSDAASIKKLTGYGNTSVSVNDSDRLIAENSWYPDAGAGIKAVSISNSVKVSNKSEHEIFGVFQLNDKGTVINSNGKNPGYVKDSEFNVVADSLATKLVFYEGDYEPNVIPTSGLMKIVSLTEDAIINGITIVNDGWITVDKSNFGKDTETDPTTPLKNIVINEINNISLNKGDNKEITVTYDTTGAAITVASSNTEIADVSAVTDNKFTVTAKSGGSAKITVTCTKEGYNTATTSFDVDVKVPVESITVLPTEEELTVGNTLQIVAEIKPDDATEKSVNWTTSDPKVATIDENGKVTAIGVGTAIITATVENTTKSAKTTVNVLEKINVDPISGMIMDLNSTKEVTVTCDITGVNITVETSDEKIADVSAVTDNKFTITAKSGGSATITITCTKNGYKTQTISFGVNVVLTDEQKLAADKESLTIPLGENSAMDNIKVKLGDLPTKLPNGTTVEWTSSNPSVISNDGQTVTRPAESESDVKVTMTATLKNGSAEDTKTFDLTVKMKKKLPTPKISIDQFGRISWQVSGLVQSEDELYDVEILIKKGNDEYTINTKAPYYYSKTINIGDEIKKLGAGYYSIQMRIKDTGYDDSDFSKTYGPIYQLADPEPYWDNYYARWSPIENAALYILYLYENGNRVKLKEKDIYLDYTTTSEIKFNLSEYVTNPDSEYSFEVQAINDYEINGNYSYLRSSVVKSVKTSPTKEIELSLVTTSASISYNSNLRYARIYAENGTEEIILEVTKTEDQTINEASGIELPIYSETETETGIKVVYKISTAELANYKCKILRLRVNELGKISNFYDILIAGKLEAPSLSVREGEFGDLVWNGSEDAYRYIVTYYFKYTDKDGDIKTIKIPNDPYKTYITNFSTTLIRDETGPYGGVFTATVTPIYGDFVGFESEESNEIIKLSSVTSGELTRIGQSNAVKATWEDDDKNCKYLVALFKNGYRYYDGDGDGIFQTNGNEHEASFSYLPFAPFGGEYTYTFTVQKIGDGTVINSNPSEQFGSVVL